MTATKRLVRRGCGLLGRFVVAVTIAAGSACLPAAVAYGQNALSPGAALYRDGRLPSGEKLRGMRESGAMVEGAAAACVNCHRRSGLGSLEGTTVIPPITGKYLLRSHQVNVEDLTLPHVAGSGSNREPYTDVTLARAIREGIASNGRPLNYLMPRYSLDDATMATLLDYLKELTSGPVPGVTDETLQFATIIAPDADPQAKQGMLDVLEHFIATQNKVIAAEVRPLHASREIMYRVTRQWRLHVWQLTGNPETWEHQLDEHLAQEPVFAVISGLGGSTWAPVHHFCERQSLPCLLPNVDLPVVEEGDFYPVYYSRGVLLEADLLARDLRARGKVREAEARLHLVQVYHAGDVGEAAAAEFAARLADLDLERHDRRLSGQLTQAALTATLSSVRSGDVLVLWLRPADLARLPPLPPRAAVIYLSGLMGGLEHAPLPTGWRDSSHMSYPVDLPDPRRARMNYPLGWFHVQQIPIVNERVQTDTYLACQIVSEALGHMLDSFVRDYLVERLEMIVSRRLANAYYPRLGLAPGQRFASKGGYLVKLAGPGPQGDRVVAETEWTVP
jgi:hypothetical protein